MNTLKQIKENIDTRFLTQSGELQIISPENYMQVLKENQKKIIEIDRDYVQKFVKIGSYLKSSQKNIFDIFQRVLKNDFENFMKLGYYSEHKKEYVLSLAEVVPKIIETTGTKLGWKEIRGIINKNIDSIMKLGGLDLNSHEGLDNNHTILKELNQHIILYNDLVISSFKMIKSLHEDDMITFYEMYEVFDKLGIFDTQWQKTMLEKFGEVKSTVQDMTDSLNNVNSTIKKGMDNLSSEIVSMSTELSSGFDMVSTEIGSMSTDLSVGLDNLSSDIQSLDS